MEIIGIVIMAFLLTIIFWGVVEVVKTTLNIKRLESELHELAHKYVSLSTEDFIEYVESTED